MATTTAKLNDISERARIHPVKLEEDQKYVKLTISLYGIDGNACAIEAIRLLNHVRKELGRNVSADAPTSLESKNMPSNFGELSKSILQAVEMLDSLSKSILQAVEMLDSFYKMEHTIDDAKWQQENFTLSKEKNKLLLQIGEKNRQILRLQNENVQEAGDYEEELYEKDQYIQKLENEGLLDISSNNSTGRFHMGAT